MSRRRTWRRPVSWGRTCEATAERLRSERERAEQGPSFRELADAYMQWLKEVKRAKPATLADYRYLLAEPGTPHRRGEGVALGRIMAALGDRPAGAVTVREIEQLLSDLGETGVSARSINKHRSVVSAIFGYGMKASTFGLPSTP